MTTLRKLFKRPLRPLPSKLVLAILAIAAVGFIDSAYLSIEHLLGRVPPCTLTSGCELVLTSSYSVIFGIPVALFGAVYYLLIVIGCFIFIESKHISKLLVFNSEILKLSLFLTFPGFLASIWFTCVQIFILRSYCMYCLGSALITTALFAIFLYVAKKYGYASESL